MYAVKEIYDTIQGEGAQAGRPAVFLRFAGCHLWTGREQDRTEAICQFCDTDFVGTDGPGGGKFATSEALASHLLGVWNSGSRGGGTPYVIFTGGVPMLQVVEAFVDDLRHIHIRRCPRRGDDHSRWVHSSSTTKTTENT